MIGLGADPSRTLVISQVLLSFGIPFALIPLVLFTAKRDLMGVLVNAKATNVAAVIVAGVIVGLNIFLLVQTFTRNHPARRLVYSLKVTNRVRHPRAALTRSVSRDAGRLPPGRPAPSCRRSPW